MKYHKLLKRLGGLNLDNERDIIINNIEENMPNEEKTIIIGKIPEGFNEGSDEEIFVEIIRVNKGMEEELTEEQYREIFEKLEGIRPMLSEDQNKKLDRVLKTLNK